MAISSSVLAPLEISHLWCHKGHRWSFPAEFFLSFFQNLWMVHPSNRGLSYLPVFNSVYVSTDFLWLPISGATDCWSIVIGTQRPLKDRRGISAACRHNSLQEEPIAGWSCQPSQESSVSQHGTLAWREIESPGRRNRVRRLQFGRHCRGYSIHRRLIVFISVTHVASVSHFIPGIPQPLELVTRGGIFWKTEEKYSTDSNGAWF